MGVIRRRPVGILPEGGPPLPGLRRGWGAREGAENFFLRSAV
jgi:hypothetical protein